MGIFSRILGISRTRPPGDAGAWKYEGGRVEIDLSRAGELAAAGGALRLEGGGLPIRVLVVHGEDGRYYAFKNKCTHAGRRLDPLPGQPALECCSISKSRFDNLGRKMSGPASGPVESLSLEESGGRLMIAVS